MPSMLRDISSTKLCKALFEYIIEDMQPLSIVESPAFRKLIGSICHDLMVKNVKEALEAVDGVSTTADVRTANHRSYLGMTVHWIDTDTLKRC